MGQAKLKAAMGPDRSFFDRVERMVRNKAVEGRLEDRVGFVSLDSRGSTIMTGLSADREPLDDEGYAERIRETFFAKDNFHGYAIVHRDETPDGGIVRITGTAVNGMTCDRAIPVGADGRLGAAAASVGRAAYRDIESPGRGGAEPLSIAGFFDAVEAIGRGVQEGCNENGTPDEGIRLQVWILLDGSRRAFARIDLDRGKTDAEHAEFIAEVIEEKGAQAYAAFFGAEAAGWTKTMGEAETAAKSMENVHLAAPMPATIGNLTDLEAYQEPDHVVMVIGAGIDGSACHRRMARLPEGRLGKAVAMAGQSPYLDLYPRDGRFQVSEDGRIRV